MPDRPLSSGEVADLFGVTVTTIAAWVEAGKLPHFRTLGGQLRFHRSEIEPLLAPAAATAGQVTK